MDSLGTTTLNNNIGSIGQSKKIVTKDALTGKEKVTEVRITEVNEKSGEMVLRADIPLTKLDDLLKK